MSKTIVTGRDPFRAVMHLDWARPPVNANQRGAWQVHSRAIANVRQTATLLSRDIPAFDAIRVSLRWVVATKHRRDADNIVPTLKALCDGLVDADVVPDDTPQFMTKVMPEIHYDPFVPAHLEFTIEEIAA